VTAPDPDPDPAWTVAAACAYFTEGGLPMDEDTLAGVIALLRRQSQGRYWNPVGEASTEGRGRGKALYPVAELMRLHAALAPWLVPPFSGS
jgi:hypothetical protein